MKGIIFCDVTLCKYAYQPATCNLQDERSACLTYSYTLKMDAVRSSETLVNFYRTTQCDIPEDSASQYRYFL
jgi:hypothetical protein